MTSMAVRLRHVAIGAAFLAATFVEISSSKAQTAPPPPESIAPKPTEMIAVTLHAEGAQIYECKPNAAGKLEWQFREPVATLMLDGKTVGRHYVGPTWEHVDGSVVQGKVTGRLPGATKEDIPLLRLEVSNSRGNGILSGVTTIQRVETEGGVQEGPCDKAGNFETQAYSSDYIFWKPKS